ncbi:Protoporphyrinogen oxidase [Cladorrhinum sp. PSN259]|nr:Protoporphyrinogen oxidase [Cladorrhinum sp. PSN259]
MSIRVLCNFTEQHATFSNISWLPIHKVPEALTEPLTARTGLRMRDAAIRALLNMYATSPRCLARTGCSRSSAFRLLSAAYTTGTATPPRSRYRARYYSTETDANISTDPVPPPKIPNNAPRSVAVLGGGLTGLTTAWYLARFLPETKITIYEASNRLAGWIDSETVPVKTADGEEGTVNFQRGARVLQGLHGGAGIPRYDDLVFYEMVSQLGLAEKLQYTKREERPDRYIYYPDHLVQLPRVPADGLVNRLGWVVDTAKKFIQEPLYEGAFASGFNMIFQEMKGDDPYVVGILTGQEDMSVGEYWTNRFGRPDLVNNLLSAMMHGIYGGDVWKLSMSSSPFAHRLSPKFVHQLPMTETAIRREDRDLMLDILKDKDTFALATDFLKAGMLWFPDGLSSLTDRLVEELEKNPNITIKTGEPVTAVHYHEKTDSVAITTPSQQRPISYHKVVSTIFAKTLASLCDRQLPTLEKSTATTIQVVTLWYPVAGLNHPNSGFGYLLPQTLNFEQNPECVLGVLFDSDREFLPNPEEPGTFFNRGSDTVHGTKLTVMMGGHYWDDLPEELLPDAKSAAEQAKKAVARHLGWPESWAEHAVAGTKLCRECIPQHVVGHIKRMRAAAGELSWAFKGKLAVVGGSYQPPGVMSSIRGARDIAQHIARSRTAHTLPQISVSVGDSGLERMGVLSYASMQRRLMPLRFGSGAYVDEKGNLMPKGGLDASKSMAMEKEMEGGEKRS